MAHRVRGIAQCDVHGAWCVRRKRGREEYKGGREEGRIVTSDNALGITVNAMSRVRRTNGEFLRD